MKTYYGVNSAFAPKRRAIAIGIFDGVHLGHQKILKSMLRLARRKSLSSMVITFEPHPDKIFSPNKAHPVILSLAHRLRLFESLGVQETLVIRFDKKFSHKSAEDFLERFLIGRLRMKALIVGEDFRFGRFAKGDAAYLKEESRKNSFKFLPIAPVRVRARVISSTAIRRLILKGDFKQASRMLGRPVALYGCVVHGKGRGKAIGFPTANINPDHETLPPAGVYSGWVKIGRKTYKGVVHIGQRPTFAEKEATLEAHVLGFNGALYGRQIELIFSRRLRQIKKFKNFQALQKAILGDISRAEKTLYKSQITKYN